MGDTRIRDLERTVASLEARLKAERKADQRLEKARRLALEKATERAEEIEKIHFESLNKANERFDTQNATFLAADIFENYRKTQEERIRHLEQAISEGVTRTSFLEYKDATQKALDLQSGQRHGIGITGTTISQVIMSVGIIGALLISALTFFSGTRALPVSNPVTYIPGGFPGPAGLVAPPTQAAPPAR
jgi:hypothetical protein